MKRGMKIYFDKCIVLTRFADNILIQGEHNENVNNFVYLESFILNVSKDIERRIDLVLPSFS